MKKHKKTKAGKKKVTVSSKKKAKAVSRRIGPAVSRTAKKKFVRTTKLNKKTLKAPPSRRQTIVILDFGSQYTQLIARRIRENKVFSCILPYNVSVEVLREMSPKGIILSGGPASVYEKNSPLPEKGIFKLGIPVLGVCYGMQAIAKCLSGKVKYHSQREFGKTEVFIDDPSDLLSHLPGNITCWMSHSDLVKKCPPGFSPIAHTLNTDITAMADRSRKIYAVQFHPEVTHTIKGNQIISNFLFKICGCFPRWTIQSFIREAIDDIRKTVGKKRVVLGLSGGVDSSVCAVLVHRAVDKNLKAIFIDNGLLRKDEADNVKKTFQGLFRMNLDYVNQAKRFLSRLKGVTDPEQKRKIIGEEFVKVFEEEAVKFKNVEFLAQGTLYPDVIESVSPTGGPSARIKSHHNVGGLPLNMKLKLIEPLRELFKDEVREMARQLGLPEGIIYRQPFPGPGLSVRILGEVTEERLRILREVDKRLIEEIRAAEFYNKVWQSFAVLLPVKTVGVMGDSRTYENVVAIRCVESLDGMTADWTKLPYELLEKLSHRIINEVKGVNRVVYDISSKPPATIEWE